MNQPNLYTDNKISKGRRNLTSAVVPDYGKIPPQAVELEETVLGALMLDRDALSSVIDILRPDAFYKPAHQMIFKAIVHLFQKSEPIDILTVTTQLQENAELEVVGGPYFIAQLTSKVGSAANLEFHARIIIERFIKRELIRISTETINQSFEETSDVFEILDQVESKLFDVTQGNIKQNESEMSLLINKAIKQIETAANETGLTGVPSGFHVLDQMTAGWQKANLVIVAARPGMGKTAFSLALARNAAVDHKVPIAYFSLEMTSLELVNRLISSETGISSETLKRGTLNHNEWQQIHSNLNRLSDAKIFIDDTPGLSIFNFRAKARRLKQHHNIGLILVDYLQLMTAGIEKGGMREQEISIISRSLKSIAKELNVPIIALSQLSRAVETRGGDKKPMLSDLRESGAIEQDADMVSFIYRPEYYKILQGENGESLEGIAKIIIAKHRNGATGEVDLRFIPHMAKFDNLEFSGDYESPTRDQMPYGYGLDEFTPPAKESGSITKPSKMNDDLGDIPF